MSCGPLSVFLIDADFAVDIMHDAALIFFSGIALVSLILPLPSHLRANNSSTVLNIAWLFVGNLINFVNSIAWRDSTANRAPVWCDISEPFRPGRRSVADAVIQASRS